MLLPEMAWLNDVQLHGASPHNGYRLEEVRVERVARSSSEVRPQAHGALVRTAFYGGALLNIKGWVEADGNSADATLQERWSALLGSSRLQRATGWAALLGATPNVFQFQPRGEEALWYYECTEESPPQDSGSVAPWMAWEGAYLANRPWAESVALAERSYDPTAAGSGSGLVWPITWPIDWTSGEVGDDLLQVENLGNTMAYPQLTITGPAVNPYIRNETESATLQLQNLTLASGDTVTLDTYTRRILAGGTERPDLLDPAQSSWWGLAPGVSLIRLGGTGFLAGTTRLTVMYRHARYF